VGVFGALFPVVVADLTRGSGRFNAAQGSVGTVHSAGGLLSGLVANAVVVWAGYGVAFLLLAAVAALGAALFGLTMPETRPRQGGGLPSAAPGGPTRPAPGPGGPP